MNKAHITHLTGSAIARSARSFRHTLRDLGFRSAPPQALRYGPAPRAKANQIDDQLDQSLFYSGRCDKLKLIEH